MRAIDTRKCPVLFEAPLAADLFGSFVQAVSGGALYRKSTFLLDSLGKPVFPPHIQIRRRPARRAAASARAPFDEEGVRTRGARWSRMAWCRAISCRTYSARKLGHEDHRQRRRLAQPDADVVADRSGDDFAAMIRKMGRGLLVTELMGQGINYVTGDYSRGASGFWVENGEIQYPVEEITIAGNMKDMFQQIVAVGNDVLTRGNKQTGSILIENMVVAGG